MDDETINFGVKIVAYPKKEKYGNLHDVKGFGLGLAFAREIAKAHKGKLIYLSPASGKGSIFRLEIPLESTA